MDEQTSCTNPGRVSSAERTPPPITSDASITCTDRPARARVMAAARPFGPAPTTTASSTCFPSAESVHTTPRLVRRGANRSPAPTTHGESPPAVLGSFRVPRSAPSSRPRSLPRAVALALSLVSLMLGSCRRPGEYPAAAQGLPLNQAPGAGPPAPPNHAWYTKGAKPYLDYFSLPGNERYYTFSRGPIDFFALDSAPNEPDGNDPHSKQARWFKAAAAQAKGAWQIVYMHHPPHSSGPHGSSPE